MSFMERIMRRFHWIPKETRDDTINASIEEKALDHSNLVGELHEALKRRSQSNGVLRESIRIAKHRTNSFADFERMAIRREEMK
jgi:hypothetical protein